MGRVLDQDEAGPSSIIIRCPAQPFRLVGSAKVPIRLPPYRAVAVDSSLPCYGDSVLVANIDERSRPCHLNARNASGEHRIVNQLLRADECDALRHVERHTRFEKERSGQIDSRFQCNCTAMDSCRVDSLLNGYRYESRTISLGSVVVGHKRLRRGVSRAGAEQTDKNSAGNPTCH